MGAGPGGWSAKGNRANLILNLKTLTVPKRPEAAFS